MKHLKNKGELFNQVLMVGSQFIESPAAPLISDSIS